ncbi:MAG: hypothetical protein M1829_004500 [Trizodia sp. TS-e1964]|nr:MAG: hypothetical protein M1829_004500 [Trizodia sp. TS-e1964]
MPNNNTNNNNANSPITITPAAHLLALPASLAESLAGFTAGVASTLAVHPLDVIKTRLQIDRRTRPSPIKLGSTLRIARSIVQHEGGLRALYRGLSPNLLGNSTSWGLYFFWYSRLKPLLAAQQQQPWSSPSESAAPPPHPHPSTATYLLSSFLAGSLTTLLTNPIWVLKTRMLSTAASHPGAYPSLFTGLTSILRADGPAGLYRGLAPALLSVSQGAVQFALYERLKDTAVQRRRGEPRSRKLGNATLVLLSSLAKLGAGVLAYPVQVVRVRLQAYDAPVAAAELRRAATARGTVLRMWREEGPLAFYRGLGPNLLRVLPATWVTFLVYENVLAGLREEG